MIGIKDGERQRQIDLDRLEWLNRTIGRIEAKEPAGRVPDWLAEKCYADVLQTHYGVRTYAEAQKVADERKTPADPGDVIPQRQPQLVPVPDEEGKR